MTGAVVGVKYWCDQDCTDPRIFLILCLTFQRGVSKPEMEFMCMLDEQGLSDNKVVKLQVYQEISTEKWNLATSIYLQYRFHMCHQKIYLKYISKGIILVEVIASQHTCSNLEVKVQAWCGLLGFRSREETRML